MPLLTKSRQRTAKKTDNPGSVQCDTNENVSNCDGESPDSLLKTMRGFEKELRDKEDILRRLELVKTYKSRKDIQDLDGSILKWKCASKQAIEELYANYVSNFRTSSSDTHEPIKLCEFIKSMNVDPKLIGYDAERECFTN